MSIVEVQVMELKIYIIALTFPQLLCDVVFITIFFFATLHCSEAPHVPLLRNQYFISTKVCIRPCSTNIVNANNFGVFLFYCRFLHFVGYEMIIANLMLGTLLAVYHFIFNACL